jgi:6-phosphogluconolactonase
MGRVQLIVDEKRALGDRFARQLTSLAHEAATLGTTLRIALAGGSVAQVFLPALAQAPLDESVLEVFFCDERAVPLHHPDSNFKLAHDLWLDGAAVPKQRVHPLYGEDALERVAHHYEQALRQRAEDPLDVVLLGVGPDGHIASLFPGHAALNSARWVEVVRDSPKPPAQRLTMTLSVLLRARHIFVAAFGAEKASVLEGALAGDVALPVGRLLARAPSSTVLVDQELAGRLSAHYLSGGAVSVQDVA